jgi:hypothetical protein
MAMTGTGRPEEIIDAEFVEIASPSVALAPVSLPPDASTVASLNRPDPTFLTQLIANADHAPLASADAQAAYGRPKRERRSVARRTKQII